MVKEYNLVQTKMMAKMRSFEERFRNISTQNRIYLQNIEKIQEALKTCNLQSEKMNNLKKSNLKFEQKLREIQEIGSKRHNNLMKLLLKFVNSTNLIENNSTRTYGVFSNQSRQFHDAFQQYYVSCI